MFENTLGEVQTLHDGVSVFLMGVDGIGYPTINQYSMRAPYQTGATYLAARAAPKTIALRVALNGTSLADLERLERGFMQVMDFEKGLGILRVTRTDQVIRQLDCVLQSGLEFVDAEKTAYLRRSVISLFAPDPRWYDPQPVSLTVTPKLTSGGLIFPVTFPITIGTSTPQLGVPFVMQPQGTAAMEPVIAITGPCTNPVVMNVTQGRYLRFLLTLGQSDVLNIDLRPGSKNAVLIQAGTTWPALQYLTTSSRFFTIDPTPQYTTLLCTADSGALSGTFFWQWLSHFWRY